MRDDAARHHESEHEKLVRHNQDHSGQQEVRRLVGAASSHQTQGQQEALSCSQEHQNLDEVKGSVEHGLASIRRLPLVDRLAQVYTGVTAYPLQRQFCDSAYHRWNETLKGELEEY